VQKMVHMHKKQVTEISVYAIKNIFVGETHKNDGRM
jgi:hypothetical protein